MTTSQYCHTFKVLEAEVELLFFPGKQSIHTIYINSHETDGFRISWQLTTMAPGFKARGQCLDPSSYFCSTEYTLNGRWGKHMYGSPTLSLCPSGWWWDPGLGAGCPVPLLGPGLASPPCCFSCSRNQTRQVHPGKKHKKKQQHSNMVAKGASNFFLSLRSYNYISCAKFPIFPKFT